MQPDEYRKMAEVEDAMWYYRALHRHVLRTLGALAPTNARVLDAGCGTGGLLRQMRAARADWVPTGLDFSPLACAAARERTGIEIAQGSIAALPFPDAHFDAVVSCDVVCQVADPAAAVREFHRVLRPGGALVLTMPAYGWMYSYHDREVGNLRRYTRGEVAALLRAGGFAVMRNTYWNTLPFPLAVLRRKVFPPARPTSDVGRFPAPVEAAFSAMMAFEHGWLGSGLGFPFGTSVLTAGQKS